MRRSLLVYFAGLVEPARISFDAQMPPIVAVEVDQDPAMVEVAYFGRAAAAKRSPAVGRKTGVLGPITLSDEQLDEWRREEAGRA